MPRGASKETSQHVSTIELERGIDEVVASPKDDGRLVAIFVRPAPNERRQLKMAKLSTERGIHGDRWSEDSFYRLKGGTSDPRCQVSLMNSRYLRQIANQDNSALCLAGDNLMIDFDLSEANMPTGARLAIGDEVVIEISDLKHTGCSKFKKRYGKEALTFTNNERGRLLHLRGRYARIVSGGTIRVGDAVRKSG